MPALYIRLQPDALRALDEQARAEKRNPQSQAAWLLEQLLLKQHQEDADQRIPVPA